MSPKNQNYDDRTFDDARALEILRSAGWFSGRSVAAQVNQWSSSLDRPGGFEIFDAARSALTEFGGLCVTGDGAGQDFASGSFNIDPMLAQGEEERFAEHAAQLKTKLYPLGEAYSGNAFLAIDRVGYVYLLLDTCEPLASSILDALKSLILGKRPS